MSSIDELEKLVGLKAAGALSEEEFEVLKREILAKSSDNGDGDPSVAELPVPSAESQAVPPIDTSANNPKKVELSKATGKAEKKKYVKFALAALAVLAAIAGYFIYESMNQLDPLVISHEETLEGMSDEGKRMHEDWDRERESVMEESKKSRERGY